MKPKLESILRALSKADPVSIGEYSSQFVEVIRGLCRYDETFSVMHFERERMNSVKVDLSLLSIEDSLGRIAELIIEFNRYDIRKFGKTKDPDFSYIPSHPISMLVKFDTKHGELYFNVCMCRSKAALPDAWISSGGSAIVKNGLHWGVAVFKIMMDILNYGYGSVGSFYRDDIRKESFKGWLLNCSYFSKNGPYVVPEGIPGVDYEETKNGVYLNIGNKLCTSTDDPEYQEQKQIRLEATRRIKQANGLS